MTDPTLFKPGPRDGHLTDRQQLVYQLLRDHRDGITALEAGLAVHELTRCPYCQNGACRYARETGNDVLRSLSKRGLAIRRRTGRWQLRHRPLAEAPDPSTDPIPF